MKLKGIVLFDIDGVIRDVSNSYRLALKETVNTFCNWRPSSKDIDDLKSEGNWNNDWDASHELIKRHVNVNGLSTKIPSKKDLINCFSEFYFGGNPNSSPVNWKGFIKNEPLLVKKDFFEELTSLNFKWGFVSGAEPQSAKFVLETRLRLEQPPLIAMGDAPDKPDPSGLLQLTKELLLTPLGESITPPVAYVGDTIADIKTIVLARKKVPNQKFISIGVIPPHINLNKEQSAKNKYRQQLKDGGADEVFFETTEIIKYLKNW